MAIAIDFQYGALMALSAVNAFSEVGATDTTVSGNATTAGLIAAILALAPTAGAAPDALRIVANGLQWGLNAGVIAASHGQTTIAGLASSIAAFLNMEVAAGFQSYLPQ